MATSPITIRHGTIQDAQPIARLGSNVFSLCFGHSVPPHELKAYLDEYYSLQAIEQDIQDPNKQFLVATATEDVAATSLNTGMNVNGSNNRVNNVIDTNSENRNGIAKQTQTERGEEFVLGFAQLTRGTTEPCLLHIAPGLQIELQRIYVYPSFHGSGAGKALSDAMESLARSQGYKYMWLGVWEENLKAQKAYAKWGYEKVGSHDFAIGDVVQTDLILVKPL